MSQGAATKRTGPVAITGSSVIVAIPRVLVVDDDRTLLYLAQIALEEGGFEVETAADGTEALAALQATRFDLMLLDVSMPGLSGFAVCRELRRQPRTEHLPVIITTGLDDDESIDAAYESGATDFVTKPLNWTALVHRARYVLRTSRALAEVLDNQRRLDNAQRVAEVGDWEWDLVSDRLRVSAQGCRILGLATSAPDRVNGLFAHCDDDETIRLMAGIIDVRHGANGFAMEHRVDGANAEPRFVHHLIEPVRSEASGTPTRIVGTVQDITRRKVAEDRIRRLAYVDPLTGLPNRLSLTNMLRAAVSRADRANSRLAVMFLDLDGFKRVNDTLGHDAGDVLLRVTANRLTKTLRNSDVVARLFDEPHEPSVARLGGDEFVVLLPDLPGTDGAVAVAQRIIRALRESVPIDGQEVMVSTSIGIATYPGDGDTPEALLVAADAAMYQAKLNGRNGFQFFEASMNVKAHDRLRVEAELRTALELGEFELWFQPRLDVRTRRFTGVEALLRWNHPTRGSLPPGQFLDAARQGPLLAGIEDWVLANACRAAARFDDGSAAPLPVAVNISEMFLRRADCIESVERALADARITPSRLELEFPAVALLQQTELTLGTIRRLHESGLRFALDDFGVANTSLPQLKRVPIHALKIDRSFIEQANVRDDDAAILRSIIGLARGLGVRTIAEGVESAAQIDFLASVGCDDCQGYHVARPMPEPAMRALLQRGYDGAGAVVAAR